MNKQQQNLVFIYTGDGKGKTTAALGLAFRALAYDKKVLVLQFLKSSTKQAGWVSGEQKIKEKFKALKIKSLGLGFVKILGDNKKITEHKKAAAAAFNQVEQEIKKNKWDVLILDEILVAYKIKILKISDLKKIIRLFKKIGKNNVLVLTGRGFPKTLSKNVDLITEMKAVKHPFQKGIVARAGVDY